MTMLSDYQHFNGRHWETGSVHHFMAYRGYRAPHTGEPYSEALLMGVGGGAVVGYFTFAYDGYEPMCRILTRNTFDPLQTMLSRLGIVQHWRQTASPEKGLANLIDTLDSGVPAIVWADRFSLPYNAAIWDERNWAMFPILVYGYEATKGCAWLADRSKVPLAVSTEKLQQARARVKNNKFRLLTIDPPDPGKLAAAVQAGIWDCINLYTEKPPKGSQNNFGLQALRYWADMLRNPQARQSWQKIFPAGRKMFAGLREAFIDIRLFGKDCPAERDMYADFLEEAALILERPALQNAAAGFRKAGKAWRQLSEDLLPDSDPQFERARRLLLEQHNLFWEHGDSSRQARLDIHHQLEAIAADMEADFPLSGTQVVAFRQQLAQQVMQVHDCEQAAVETLRKAIQ